VNSEVERLVKQMHEAGKPIGFICITPASIGAKVFGDMGVKVKLTIGSDPDTAAAVAACGCEHVVSTYSDIVVDDEHKVVSTAAYMSAGGIAEAAEGIEALVKKVLAMA
jgi:enhancing lycopene biosynthesis protein 2